ncbi:hypothetical protein OF83DRAFT_1064095 [Amylostereum chailletii]|nr:hypothetical protein OF83DRAFT_1064095 [Amylostereum chailletii]
MEKSESLQLEVCIPQSWWEFSIQHAVHLYNRTPLRRHSWQTPYQILTEEPLRIDHFHVFGCGAYVKIPDKARKNKMSPKSELMTYLGIAPGGHGNIFLRTPNNTVFTSAHALFDETLFPKCPTATKHCSTQLPSNAPGTEQTEDIPLIDDDDNTSNNHPLIQPSERRQEPSHNDAGVQPQAHNPSPPPPLQEEPQCSGRGGRSQCQKGKQPERRSQCEKHVPQHYGDVKHESEKWSCLFNSEPGSSRT